jgi:hypothetical protein
MKRLSAAKMTIRWPDADPPNRRLQQKPPHAAIANKHRTDMAAIAAAANQGRHRHSASAPRMMPNANPSDLKRYLVGLADRNETLD